MARGTVLISAVGTETSLGNAVTSFSAARAGLTRRAGIPEASYRDRIGDEQPVHGHGVSHVQFHQGWARWLSLSLLAIEDLMGRVEARRLSWPVGLIVCLPDPMAFPRETAPLPVQEQLKSLFLSKLLALSGNSGRFERPLVLTSGPAGFVVAIRSAFEMLRSGTLASCVVGAVDSYLDADTLAWLGSERRLKTLDEPQGLQPGEAAAFLLIERARREFPAAPGLELTAATLQEDPEREDTPRGAWFIGALRRANVEVGRPPKDPWFMIDHNGEPDRADDYAWFVNQLQATWPEAMGRRMEIPAIAFGDCGTARGALGTGWALRAVQRGYCRGNDIVVLVTGDRRERGLVWLRPTS